MVVRTRLVIFKFNLLTSYLHNTTYLLSCVCVRVHETPGANGWLKGVNDATTGSIQPDIAPGTTVPKSQPEHIHFPEGNLPCLRCGSEDLWTLRTGLGGLLSLGRSVPRASLRCCCLELSAHKPTRGEFSGGCPAERQMTHFCLVWTPFQEEKSSTVKLHCVHCTITLGIIKDEKLGRVPYY